VKELIKKL